jgi:hypothetical protein
MLRVELWEAGAGAFESEGAAGAWARAAQGTSAATAKQRVIERQVPLLACM